MQIELTKLVDTIIGSYKAYGHHEDDMKALTNLNDVEELLKHMILQLCDNVQRGFDSSAYSVEIVGERSAEILGVIHEQIEGFAKWLFLGW